MVLAELGSRLTTALRKARAAGLRTTLRGAAWCRQRFSTDASKHRAACPPARLPAAHCADSRPSRVAAADGAVRGG
jgi:hypothetical protein